MATAAEPITFPTTGLSADELRAELTEASQGDARWKERLAERATQAPSGRWYIEAA